MASSHNPPPGEPQNSGNSFLTIENLAGREKAAWVKAAQYSGMKLRDWVIQALNAQAAEVLRQSNKPEEK